MNQHAPANPKIESPKQEMPRPVLNIVIPASRFLGSISEEYMSEYSSARLNSGFLEQLLRQQGVPVGTIILLRYTMLEQALTDDSPARFGVTAIASSPGEIDQFYETIMQVLKPYMHVTKIVRLFPDALIHSAE